MKTRIIVDSTADLVPEIKARVYTVPLTVHFGQEEYIDGVTIDHRTFYEKLVESDVMPTTSQATPSDFIEEFEKAKQEGEAAVVITLASKFSGTYQSAMIAAADYENIYVVDGTSAAMGTGILVELAFRLLDAGMSAKEIADALEEEKKKIDAQIRTVQAKASQGTLFGAAMQRPAQSPLQSRPQPVPAVRPAASATSYGEEDAGDPYGEFVDFPDECRAKDPCQNMDRDTLF
mgnify:CR=1 FL=1